LGGAISLGFPEKAISYCGAVFGLNLVEAFNRALRAGRIGAFRGVVF